MFMETKHKNAIMNIIVARFEYKWAFVHVQIFCILCNILIPRNPRQIIKS